ncbi:hypothetical protein ERO13_D04G191300v2 [Gossypium hirsutum]|uniref:cAMP-regulated phosphoprotein 19-related protein n=5 Tax=Gossypium TaxID=3633 RepID=A0A1U8IUY7_GOSHI|nr:uncharacterized protein LOC107898723 [Gossypium hirsutum]XP_052485323.1 uncharacterized protein LOC105780607 [Gossypium raimondii]KAB2036404.1 hypothetical protein ES319_D04G222500v1 [Gossypium barbadense]TYG75054.1 hypothetical protein ES288_D04G233000v1 [Gossypium darwinii]TYH78573.1 hypothetical protein ES332_D04G235400v1 [Gossypium tomentosum]KAG4153570.1 hypothetical protein ERO13_D04G191300v2 [Gossypium hirsutum]KJB78265.1 hypothetical protein B456_012G186700 [Gossypium raimondii]
MSQTNDVEGVKEKKVMNDGEKIQVDDGKDQIFGEEVALSEELKDSDENENEKNLMPSATEEEEAIKKKYGGLLPKKPTLISKNHDRAFFDSADWALGKQGSQKPKGPLEALRPKLQPTPHQQMRSRRSVYAPAEDDNEASSSEDQSCTLEGDNDNINSGTEEHVHGDGDET